jgi:hypothetical protein
MSSVAPWSVDRHHISQRAATPTAPTKHQRERPRPTDQWDVAHFTFAAGPPESR